MMVFTVTSNVFRIIVEPHCSLADIARNHDVFRLNLRHRRYHRRKPDLSLVVLHMPVIVAEQHLFSAKVTLNHGLVGLRARLFLFLRRLEVRVNVRDVLNDWDVLGTDVAKNSLWRFVILLLTLHFAGTADLVESCVFRDDSIAVS